MTKALIDRLYTSRQPEISPGRLKGRITQEGVADDFRALVPIYLVFDRGQFVRVGLLPMIGKASLPVDVTLKPPKKPRGVLINARSEVLARD